MSESKSEGFFPKPSLYTNVHQSNRNKSTSEEVQWAGAEFTEETLPLSWLGKRPVSCSYYAMQQGQGSAPWRNLKGFLESLEITKNKRQVVGKKGKVQHVTFRTVLLNNIMCFWVGFLLFFCDMSSTIWIKQYIFCMIKSILTPFSSSDS